MRKLTIVREKHFVNGIVQYCILIDDHECAVQKNGETVVLEIPSGTHTIQIMNKLSRDNGYTHNASNIVTISEDDGDVLLKTRLKMNFIQNKIFLDRIE